jgi:acetamidase/formamidase
LRPDAGSAWLESVPNHHTLPAGPDTCHWGFFDAALKPVLTIESGDTVTISSVSGPPEVLPPAPFEVLPDHRAVLAGLSPRMPGHILTGPIAISGARPGDVLEVEMLSVECRQNWGYSAIRPLAGSLPEDFPVRKIWHTAIDRQRGVATLPWGTEIALAPFFGVMGVAPPPVYGAVTSIVPREFGGNLDLKELGAGAKLYLPVWTEGALFSAGDGHGVQGDGEVCLTALETALGGTLRLTLRRDMKLDFPRAETPTHHITLGLDEDLDDAAKAALRRMIRLIGEKTGLSAADAYMLCSLACDLRVTQLVDGNKGIHAMLAKSFIEAGVTPRKG